MQPPFTAMLSQRLIQFGQRTSKTPNNEGLSPLGEVVDIGKSGEFRGSATISTAGPGANGPKFDQFVFNSLTTDSAESRHPRCPAPLRTAPKI